MRNVRRIHKPKSLKDNYQRWTDNLLSQLKIAKKNGKKCSSHHYNHYNKPDIKTALIKMYKGCCCYCESRVESIIDECEDDGKKKYGHIEHLKPKYKYPKNCFDWDNLHLACPDCNITKGEKYNRNFPILDPCKDNPIESHFEYKLDGLGVYVISLGNRAETTEIHADLNRNVLLENRLKVFMEMINNYKLWKKLTNEVEKRSLRRIYEKSASEEQYGSVIRSVLQDFFN